MSSSTQRRGCWLWQERSTMNQLDVCPTGPRAWSQETGRSCNFSHYTSGLSSQNEGSHHAFLLSWDGRNTPQCSHSSIFQAFLCHSAWSRAWPRPWSHQLFFPLILILTWWGSLTGFTELRRLPSFQVILWDSEMAKLSPLPLQSPEPCGDALGRWNDLLKSLFYSQDSKTLWEIFLKKVFFIWNLYRSIEKSNFAKKNNFCFFIYLNEKKPVC